MVSTVVKHKIRWLTPSPVWGDASKQIRLPQQDKLFLRPTILRFANDNFIEELQAMLKHSPERISEWEVQPETWREPMVSPKPIFKTRPEPNVSRMYNKTKLLMQPTLTAKGKGLNGEKNIKSESSSKSADSTIDQEPIKLYQSGHQRYYLVAASLIAEQAGYPDHPLSLTGNDSATFVVRALVPKDSEQEEYAFVTTRGGMVWQKVGIHEPDGNSTVQRLLAGEEQLPLFPMTYLNQCDHNRKIHTGMIPVSKRETWMAAPLNTEPVHEDIVYSIPSQEGGPTHIKEIFQADVTERWKTLIEQAEAINMATDPDKNIFPKFSSKNSKDKEQEAQDRARSLRTARDQIQTGSWYVLLDFANFLEKYLPDLWRFINGKPTQGNIGEAETKFVDQLKDSVLSPELRLALSIENLIVSQSAISDNLWEDLTELWDLEGALDIERWPSDIKDLPQVVPERSNISGFPFIGRPQAKSKSLSPSQMRLFQQAEQLMDSNEWFTKIDLLMQIEEMAASSSEPSKLKAYAMNKAGYSKLNDVEKRLVGPGVKNTNPPSPFSVPNELKKALGVNKPLGRRVTIKNSLLDALIAIKDHETGLENVDTHYDRVDPPPQESEEPVIDSQWPDFLFPLVDPDPDIEFHKSTPLPIAGISNDFPVELQKDAEKFIKILEEINDAHGAERLKIVLDNLDGGLLDIEKSKVILDSLADSIDALLDHPDPAAENTSPATQTPFLDPNKTRFVVRCVYERPGCGSLFQPLISSETRSFEMASFFDPDAPARAVRIPLPVDISPAGLRKFKKNAMFLISDMLCGKIDKIKKLTLKDLVLSVLPWPLHKDLPNVGPTGPCKSPSGGSLGMVCSLSIPIVTLCALILLLIMVSLFDIFFRWLPLLFSCFPIPGFLKGKP